MESAKKTRTARRALKIRAKAMKRRMSLLHSNQNQKTAFSSERKRERDQRSHQLNPQRKRGSRARANRIRKRRGQGAETNVSKGSCRKMKKYKNRMVGDGEGHQTELVFYQTAESFDQRSGGQQQRSNDQRQPGSTPIRRRIKPRKSAMPVGARKQRRS